MSGFVHLHLHSEYSLLDGACRIKAIPAYALAMGMKSVAITDHGAMYGALEFYNACKQVGIKPIIGCEVYVAPGKRTDRAPENSVSYYHLILLCKNEVGYKNLIYMVSKAFTEGFYSKPRIDMELLSAHCEGLVCLSGCIAGEIPQAILKGDIEKARNTASELKSLFGEDFYLEIQNHGLEEEKIVNAELISMSEQLGIELAATNDVHYIKKTDSTLQNVLVCIQTNNVLSDENPLGFETNEYYFKDEAKMRQLFPDVQRAIDNTSVIADKCNFDFDFSKYYYPKISFDAKMSAKEYLTKLTYEGFESKISKGEITFEKNKKEDYISRIEYEINTICSMGYAEYFLIVCDFVNYARTHDIPTGPGRGSGAGSLVAYLINITEVDSLEYNLLFEAFLNPERISMPDFDIDFCYFKRSKVIDYVKEKYGEERVSQIIAFGTLAPRAAIRSVGRALGMPYNEVDEVASKVPRILKITMDDVMAQPDIKSMCDSSDKIRRLINLAKQVEGMPKNISTHAAGVVICDKPIYEYVPLATSGDDILTQYNMNDIASLGLLKFDFLGIRYLTIIDDTEKMIRKKKPDFNIKEVSFNDKMTYDLLSAGKTDGVFQLESAGMKQMLSRFKPSSIRDIMSAIALYRPGPAKFIDKFIDNRQNPEKIKYTLNSLAPILNETNGCIVYQEQVMEIFRAIAGYTYGKADVVRRAISKKKADVIVHERQNFIDGAIEKGASPEDAEALFEDMTGFANYGFKKGHAAAYSFLSYRTAYLKAHYPAYYMAALLTSVLGDMNKTAVYVADAKKFGIKLLAPDVNSSEMNFTVTDHNNIRYGMLALKNVGEPFIHAIIEERKERLFSSFEDFCSRMSDRDINKRQVESLIKCGAFDSFGVYRSRLLQVYETVIDLCLDKKKRTLSGQVGMFSLEQEQGHELNVKYPDIPEFSNREKLIIEREVSGLCFSGSLFDEYKDAVANIRRNEIMSLISLDEDANDSEVTVCGVVTGVVQKNTRNGKTMAFVTLQDETGEIEAIIFNDIFEKRRELFITDKALIIKGHISQKEDEYPKIVADDASLIIISDTQSKGEIMDKAQYQNKPKTLYLRVPSENSGEARRSIALASIFCGSTPVVIYDKEKSKYFKIKGLGAEANDFLIRELSLVLGTENVVLK